MLGSMEVQSIPIGMAELHERVARLEALLQALVASLPTVILPGSTLAAAQIAGSDAGASSAAVATAFAAPPLTSSEGAAPLAVAAPSGGDIPTSAASARPSGITGTIRGLRPPSRQSTEAQPLPGSNSAAAENVTPVVTQAVTQAGPGPGAGARSGSEISSLCAGGGGGALPSLCVAMAATRVVMHQLVLPADVNTLGICTGGQVLSWIDVCAGLSAKTLAHGPCVTASVDAVHFLRPCRLGCVVIIAALVSRTFNTSMEVAVVVESEDMRTGVRHHCCSAHLTFVVRPRAGAEGMAVGLPRVRPTNTEHRAIWEGAEVRRQARLERRTRVRRNPELRDAELICRLKPITHREGGPTLPPAVTLQTAAAKARSPVAAAAAAKASCRLQSAIKPTATHGSASAQGYGDAVNDAAAAADPASAAAAVLAAMALAAPTIRQRVAPGCTTAYMTQSILPQHANTLNITFGGQVMSWMEQCAYISASRLRAPALLTAAMDSVSFVRPTRVGDILYITAQVTAIFGSSLEVMVSVFGESPYTGAGSSGGAEATTAATAASGGGADGSGGNGDSCGIFHCADAFVTVVAVDERHGTPVQVPFELEPQDAPDQLRNQGAVARRAERLALRGEFATAECTRVSLDGSHLYSPPPEVAAPMPPAADGGGGGGGGLFDDRCSSGVLDAMPPL